MLTLNETFTVPDADHAWTVINDLNTLVPCVPGARVTSADSAHAVKAEIVVRMGAMGMTFTGAMKIQSADIAGRTVTIRADTRETLGQSYATGGVAISVADGGGVIDAVANVGGKAAGMGEGVIVNVPDRPRQVLLGKRRDGGARARRSPGTRRRTRRGVSPRERSQLPRRQGASIAELVRNPTEETL